MSESADSQALCILAHDEPRMQQVGWVCSWHRRRMDSLVDDVKTDWLDLALIMEAGSAPIDGRSESRRSKQPYPPAPANLEAVALRDPRSSVRRDSKGDPMRGEVPSVLSVVASWVQLLAEERPITADLPSSVIAQLDLLARHHDWICEQTWVDDYWRELSELRTALRSALHDKTFVRIGTCYLPTTTGRCDGPLLRRNGSQSVQCFRCRESWTTPQQLARLQISLEGRA